MVRVLLICLGLLFIAGCAAVLKPVEVKRFGDISSYKYAFVGQTQILNSSVGSGYVGYGTSGGYSYSLSKSINPTDIISGILMKKGFIIVENITNPTQTLVVKYGQGGRRDVGFGYTLEVSIQILNAKTQEPVFICTAEGQGDTEADDIRIAITRCLEDL
ncbi:DUF4136 domain-containing protein [Helicobacter sp. MIT 05-5294]|uniref:DUF4136 domain-containing protein n=1 Tax=Helicobacter sp. MIT 05-5294 TaxID=1548150 RepID=UPI00051FEEA7|nr:DUF4136 domain-containing protein [Helicobacter sp. MIT 05-5294]TLD86164.1 DUF4136 domain-containing protein [Helicobacter sp. MIT 05-5294]